MHSVSPYSARVPPIPPQRPAGTNGFHVWTLPQGIQDSSKAVENHSPSPGALYICVTQWCFPSMSLCGGRGESGFPWEESAEPPSRQDKQFHPEKDSWVGLPFLQTSRQRSPQDHRAGLLLHLSAPSLLSECEHGCA